MQVLRKDMRIFKISHATTEMTLADCANSQNIFTSCSQGVKAAIDKINIIIFKRLHHR